jgi:hypothetical protein
MNSFYRVEDGRPQFSPALISETLYIFLPFCLTNMKLKPSALPAWGNAKNEDPIQNQPFVIAIPERKTL